MKANVTVPFVSSVFCLASLNRVEGGITKKKYPNKLIRTFFFLKKKKKVTRDKDIGKDVFRIQKLFVYTTSFARQSQSNLLFFY